MEQTVIPVVQYHCDQIDARKRDEELARKRKANAMECRPDDAGKLPPKLKPYSPKWERVAANLALSYAPGTYSCAACEYPVLKGYCCDFCHTMNPEGV